MADSILLVKGSGLGWYPSTEADASRLKGVDGLSVKPIKRADRSIRHHRLYFGGLLKLVLEYWEPSEGLITSEERRIMVLYSKWLSLQSIKSDAITETADEFYKWLGDERAEAFPAPHKNIVGLNTWVKKEIGFVDRFETPTGILVQVKSISFEKMKTQQEFDEFYKKAFNVCWRYVLSRNFDSEDSAYNATCQMAAMG